MKIRRITDPPDPAIRAFGYIQESTYADSEMLIPPAVFPRMIASQTGERRNFLLVAEEGAEVIGGTLFHYLPAPTRSYAGGSLSGWAFAR